MAKIWYVEKGDKPTPIGKARCGISLDKFLQLFGKYCRRYLGNKPPKFASDNSKLNGYRNYEFVVLECDSNDIKSYVPNTIGFNSFPQEGYYKIDIAPKDCEELLKKENL
jgi:hypothetical protein